MDTTKLLGRVEKNILTSYWMTKNLNQNFRVPEFRLPKCFGLDTFHRFVDPNFKVPKSKTPLVRVPQPCMNIPKFYVHRKSYMYKQSYRLYNLHR